MLRSRSFNNPDDSGEADFNTITSDLSSRNDRPKRRFRHRTSDSRTAVRGWQRLSARARSAIRPTHRSDSIVNWITANRDDLDSKAAQHGAILFRGFPLSTDQDFDRFISAFGFPNFKYEDSLSNAVRLNRTPRVFTANEAPPDINIYLHHEMAQTPVYPSKLFFFCEQAAQKGGATSLCRSDVLFARMQQEISEFASRLCEQRFALQSRHAGC